VDEVWIIISVNYSVRFPGCHSGNEDEEYRVALTAYYTGNDGKADDLCKEKVLVTEKRDT
jgi:hypothetical protein